MVEPDAIHARATSNSKEVRRGSSVLVPAVLIFSAVVCTTIAVASRMAGFGRVVPSSVNGVLDLRGRDFDMAGPAELRVAWLFVGGRLLSSAEALDPDGAAERIAWQKRSVPDLWEGDVGGRPNGQGAGTYKLTVLLPDELERPALRFLTASTAMEIEANGVLVAQSGFPSLDPSKAKSAYDPGVVELPALASRLDLVVRVSNYEYRGGGLWQPFVVGPYERLFRYKRLSDAAAIALFAFNLAIAFHCFVQFFLKHAAKTNLILCIFTAIVAIRSLVTGEYLLSSLFPALPYELTVRLEYLTAFLPLPLGLYYLENFYALRFPPFLRPLLFLPSMILAAFVPWAPLPFLTRLMPLYYPLVIGSIVAALAMFVYGSRVSRPSGSAAVAFGAVLVAVAGINDMFFASFATNIGTLLPWGLAVFTVIQDTILSGYFAKEFVKVTALAEERERHAKDMHHRVKNSLQIVSSILTLQSNRTNDTALIEALKITRDRIRSVSLAHERLYVSEREGTADLGDYLRDLSEQLERSYSGDPRDSMGAARIAVDVPSVETPVDFCVDVGLIVTELVINAYMHAAGSDGRVVLAISAKIENSQLRLVVADDGPGFPADFRPDKSDGLGFRVVTSIARQRRGSVSLESGDGSRVVVVLSIAETNR